MRQGEESFNYLYDGRGNVTALVDATAVPVASYQYDAFGRLTAGGGSLKQPFRFSTKRYFEGPGLSYYGYRFYQPGAGRWLNQDPLGEAGGLNLYGFVAGDPVNYIDPYGLKLSTVHAHAIRYGPTTIATIVLFGSAATFMATTNMATNQCGGGSGSGSNSLGFSTPADPNSGGGGDNHEHDDKVTKKGNKFFKKFKKRNPYGQRVKKYGNYTEYSLNVPGSKGTYTRWVKVFNRQGRTVKIYHDTFDKTGRFLHRSLKIPEPGRHIGWNGRIW